MRKPPPTKEAVLQAAQHLQAEIDQAWAAWRAKVDKRAAAHPDKSRTWAENTTLGSPRVHNVTVEQLCKHLECTRAKANPALAELATARLLQVKHWGVGYRDTIRLVPPEEKSAKEAMAARRKEVASMLEQVGALLPDPRTDVSRVDIDDGSVTSYVDGESRVKVHVANYARWLHPRRASARAAGELRRARAWRDRPSGSPLGQGQRRAGHRALPDGGAAMKAGKLNSLEAAERPEPEAIAPAAALIVPEDVFTDPNDGLPRYVAAAEKGNVSKRAAEEYHAAMRDLLAIVKPEPSEDKLWEWVSGISKIIEARDNVKAAVNYAVWNILNGYLLRHGHASGGWSIESWLQAAALVNAYAALCEKLSEACWHMPGVDKGDDGYGDWIDALPLAGRRVTDGILSHDLAVYTAVCTAIEHDHPKLRRMICNGENYVRMTMRDELERLFTSVAAEEDE